MSLFGDALSALTGAAQGGQGGQSPLFSEAMSLIQNQPGGLSGMIEQFESGGLGAVARSWVGTGQNQPITSDQIQQVLGSEVVQNLAAKVGLDPTQVASGLSQVLPQIIDHLTPNGEVPQDGFLAEGLDALKARFLG